MSVYGLQTIDVIQGNGRSTFIIDSGIPSLLETTAKSWCVQCPDNIDRDASPSVLYRSPTLSNGTHTLNFTLKDDGWVGFDHFVVNALDSEGSENQSNPIRSSPSATKAVGGPSSMNQITTTPSNKESRSGLVPTPTTSSSFGSSSSAEHPWISEPASIASLVVGIVSLTSLITATIVLLLRRCRKRETTKALIRSHSQCLIKPVSEA